MINSVSLSSSYRQVIANPVDRVGSTSFANVFSMTSPAPSVGDTSPVVTISDDAKSKAAGAMVYDYHYAASLSHDQFKNYLADGARQVSESQGLPEGKYDLSRLTANQASFISGDLVVNRGAKFEDTLALNSFISDNRSFSDGQFVLSNETKNIYSHALTTKVSIPGVEGGEFLAPKDSLRFLLSFQGAKISDNVRDTLDSLFKDKIGA